MLAVAVTVIEVALIVTLMVAGGKDTSTLARDTVFAAVMISVNGIVGLCLLVGALRHHLAVFNPEGTGAALATVIALAARLPGAAAVHDHRAGPGVLRRRSWPSPRSRRWCCTACSCSPRPSGTATSSCRSRRARLDDDGDGHADPPTVRAAWTSLGLLLVSLVAVVGLAKVESPAIERGVAAARLPGARSSAW